MTRPPALPSADVVKAGVGAEQQSHRPDEYEKNDDDEFHASNLR